MMASTLARKASIFLIQQRENNHLLMQAWNFPSERIRLNTQSTISRAHLHYASPDWMKQFICSSTYHLSRYSATNLQEFSFSIVLSILASLSTSASDLFNLLVKFLVLCKEEEDFYLERLLFDDFLEGAGVSDYSGLKRSIVMELLYRKGTMYSFFGITSAGFSGLISRDFERSFSQKTVKWIFFLDLERFFYSDLEVERLCQAMLL